MYLNLGNDIAVSKKDIIGIFDLDSSTISLKTREYLANAEKNGRVIYTTSELPKSFVLCSENGEIKVYICRPSPITLIKRS